VDGMTSHSRTRRITDSRLVAWIVGGVVQYNGYQLFTFVIVNHFYNQTSINR